MTGLFNTFWRHFVVLTNFSVNEVESRPFGRRWAIQGYIPGRALQGTDRARRVGIYPSRPPSAGSRVQSPVTTHSSPCRASGTRSAVTGDFLARRLGSAWDPVLPTRYTYPARTTRSPYPPRTPTAHAPACRTHTAVTPVSGHL